MGCKHPRGLAPPAYQGSAQELWAALAQSGWAASAEDVRISSVPEGSLCLSGHERCNLGRMLSVVSAELCAGAGHRAAACLVVPGDLLRAPSVALTAPLGRDGCVTAWQKCCVTAWRKSRVTAWQKSCVAGHCMLDSFRLRSVHAVASGADHAGELPTHTTDGSNSKYINLTQPGAPPPDTRTLYPHLPAYALARMRAHQ